MTEYEAPVPPRPRRSPWPLVFLLLFLATAAALAYCARLAWQLRSQTVEVVAAQETLLRRLQGQVGDAHAEIQQLRDQLTETRETAKHTIDDVAVLQGRAGESEAAIARVDAALQGGRGRAQLIAVEQLLLIANERAQLAHDARGALDALNLAQERLGALAEPRLFAIREALAQERTAVQAVPQVDREAAALSLSGLIRQVPALPLRSRSPQHRVAAEAEPDHGVEPEQGWFARGWGNLRRMLGAVFVVRRTDKPVDRLLPVEQEGLVGQLLLLKLETARAALLASNTEALRGAVNDAQLFLADYYRAEDPAVLAMRAELDRLRLLELAPKLPDLSRSLGLLRAYLDAAAR